MKKIVIAGGGIAGITVIRELLKRKVQGEITLVDPKEYFEVPFAQLRALVNPDDFSPLIRKPYFEIIPTVKHIQSKIREVKEKSLQLENGVSLDFDFLVIATGSRFDQWPLLKGEQALLGERQNLFMQEGEKLNKAESVLIIGAGPVGVELTGEIADKWPGKKVTLLQGSHWILSALSEKSSEKAEKILEKLGVDIKKNVRVSQNNEGIWIDEAGVEYRADLIYLTLGSQVNSQFVLGGSKIERNDKGFIKVNSHLLAENNPQIFAVGDVNDVPEIKLGATAQLQSKVVAENIKRLLENVNSSLKSYKPAAPMGFVTLGKKKGIAQLPFGNMDFMISLKQKDMFLSRYLG